LSVDKSFADEMTVGEMSEDKMTVDEMSCCQKFLINHNVSMTKTKPFTIKLGINYQGCTWGRGGGTALSWPQETWVHGSFPNLSHRKGATTIIMMTLSITAKIFCSESKF